MMTDKTNWQASLIEQRIAWLTTFCAMIIAMLAALQPQWFEFSFPANHPIHKQTSAENRDHPSKSIAMHTHSAAAVKNTSLKPITQATPVTQANAKVIKDKVITPTKKVTSVTPGYYVQLAAFTEKNRAHGFADQLKRKGWSVKIIKKKSGLHAVWIGPKSTKSGAEKLIKTIRSTLKQKGFIVQYNHG